MTPAARRAEPRLRDRCAWFVTTHIALVYRVRASWRARRDRPGFRAGDY